MPTLSTAVDGYVCSNDFDKATLSRLFYWVDQFGDWELSAISPDDVDAAMVTLDFAEVRSGPTLLVWVMGDIWSHAVALGKDLC